MSEDMLRQREREACEVALHLGVSLEADPLHGAVLAAISRLERELAEERRRVAYYSRLHETASGQIKDLRLELAAALDSAPWDRTGNPGYEPPKGDPDCLAIVEGEDGASWGMVRHSTGGNFADPFGNEVVVLEYWPLPPPGEKWERIWRRKP